MSDADENTRRKQQEISSMLILLFLTDFCLFHMEICGKKNDFRPKYVQFFQGFLALILLKALLSNVLYYYYYYKSGCL